MNKEALYITALKFCPNIGENIIKKLIPNFGSAEKTWNSSKSDLTNINRIGAKTVEFIGDEKIFKQAENELQYCSENNIQLTHLYDENYPILLRDCNDSPVLLYSKGNINWNLPSLSIVGTRKMTSYGKLFTEKLIEALTGENINIISGLALGIDSTAHNKAVECNLPTIGIVAHGLKTLYPSKHKTLAEKMYNKGGIASEFSLDKTPERAFFIQRNRIIAGLSTVTIIIESAYGGGAISTVKFANSYNRDVFALPGKTTDIYSQGCNKLIQNLEAQIITRPDDISKLFTDQIKPKQTELFIELTSIEKEITNLLKNKGKLQIDLIAGELNLPTFQLMPTLLDLELKNIIKPLPGKFFDLI